MARKLYFACDFDRSGDPGFPPDSCRFAAVIECRRESNLIDLFDAFRDKGIKTALLMPSKKAAEELRDSWNEQHGADGVCAL